MKEIYGIGESFALTTGPVSRTFTILDTRESEEGKWFKQGGSAICYDAFYQEAGIKHYGKLKQFYLFDPSLDFQTEANAYIEPYQALQQLISDSSALNQLYTFIPAYDILFDSDGCPYVWTNALPMLTFEEICNNLLLNEHLSVYDALYQIVQTMKSLTECIRIIHSSDLIHGDINPTNFGFYIRDGKILADGLSLFDLNTLHRTGAKQQWYNSPYYEDIQDDSMRLARPNRADVRAIGVTFCKALLCSNEQINNIINAHSLSNTRARSSIESALFSGALFEKKGVLDYENIKKLLFMIVLETVTNRASKRIDSCSELYQRFQTLEILLLPHTTRNELSRGQSIEIVNVENRRKNTIKRLHQLLLYEYPLYQFYSGQQIYKVFVFGFGSDAQRFTDAILETSQSMDIPFEIHVWGSNAIRSEKNIYLNERPALNQFFLVDNDSAKLTGDSYGSIYFHEMNGSSHEARISPVLQDNTDAQYIYVAAGNDSDNEAIANMCKSAMPEAFVICQCDQHRSLKNGIHLLCAEDKPAELEKTADLERFAFNAHLIWSGTLNTDLAIKKATFSQPYNHTSCVSHILSIKYKLHSLGIDISEASSAAEKAATALRKNSAVKDSLIASEHRRWVTEKLCDGWRNMPVQACPSYNDTKDIIGKRHVCLVRSTEKLGLIGTWSRHPVWDSASNEDLSTLDELDRMSVMLHQEYKKAANSFINNEVINAKTVSDILSLAEKYINVQLSFLEWYDSLTQLFNEHLSPSSENKSAEPALKTFDFLYARLIDQINAIGNHQKHVKETLLAKVKYAYESFRPVINGLRYHDFKKNDSELVDGIPFILTYRENITIFVPCAVQTLIHPWKLEKANKEVEAINPTEFFSYVAASTIINPQKLYLVCDTVPDLSLPFVKEKHAAIINYLRRKGLQTQLFFIAKESLNQFICEADKQNETILINQTLLPDTGNIPVGIFDFDTNKQRFTLSENIRWISYIQRNAFITLRDVTTLLGRPYDIAKQPFFKKDDWQVLFGMYHTEEVSRKAWKKICELLKDDSSRAVEIASLKNCADFTAESKHILPFECFKSAEKIISLFRDKNIVSRQSFVQRYSFNECVVQTYEGSANRKAIDDLFANPLLLMTSNEYLITETKTGFSLRCDTLSVRGIEFVTDGLSAEVVQEVYHILSELHRHGFIQFCLHTDGFSSTIDVVYGSRQIKSLFMNEGTFLEMYTYYKLRELNSFNDICTAIRIMKTDKKDKAEHEIDVFMTKGFQTYIVECKGRRLLKNEDSKLLLKEWKEKLSELLSWYGINGRGFLIVDSEDDFNDVPDPDGVMTVYKGKEIANIGRTIASLIKNGR